jgi:hypothetical protein
MIIDFGHRTYFRANPKNRNRIKTMLLRDNPDDRDPSQGHRGVSQYESLLGYAIGRDASISVLPDCICQDGFRNVSGQIETWNVFYLPTAAILTRFGKSMRLSAGWWGSY